MGLIRWLSSSLFVEKFPNVGISKSFLEIVNFSFSLLGWGVRGGSWYLCSGSSADERGQRPLQFSVRRQNPPVFSSVQNPVLCHATRPQPTASLLELPPRKKISDLLEGAEERSVSDARGLGFSCSPYHLFDLFIGCGESSLLHVGFLLLQRARATLWFVVSGLLNCSVFSGCGAQALGGRASVLLARSLSSCGKHA